ncbi:MAG: type II toxin-antitoxin system VapC family toxin [Pseudomonadota bacterium]
MKPAVFDASVATKWFVVDVLTEQATWARQHYRPHAPSLILYEVMSALWKYVPSRHISASAIGDAVESLCVDVALHTEGSYLRDAAELAVDLPHPPYDMAYVSLAIGQDIPLITADKRLSRKVAQSDLDVHIIDLEEIDQK